MTDSDKPDEPAAADSVQSIADSAVSPAERASAAKDISAELRQLKLRAEARNLKMVAYLLNLAELEALDCAGAVSNPRQAAGKSCA